MTQIGSVYGEALYGLAVEENASDEILSELTALNHSFHGEPDFIRLLSSPSIPKPERCRILDDSFRGKLHTHVVSFLKILTEKGYIKHFSDCCKSYESAYNLDHNILPVTALTAVPLTAEQAAALTAKLSRITCKTVKLQNKVDPACLGGVRLDYDGKRLDDTVSHRLDAIRSMLRDTIL